MTTPAPAPGPVLVGSMQGAWLNKAERALETLVHMRHAPALFKPEDVAEVEAEYRTAVRWARYWGRQT